MTMRSNKAIVNAAGQTITTAGLAAGGALNPEQAKKFIQQTFEATPLSGLVRHELRSAKTGEIDKIGVGRRLLRKKTENTDDGYRSGVKHGKLEYACTPVRLPWEITEETLRENIEGSNYETIVTNLMTRQIGCDREDLCLNGDERYAKVKEFSSSETYAIGDLVAYNKKVYQYTAAHTAGAFDAGEATELGTVDDADFLPGFQGRTFFHIQTEYLSGRFGRDYNLSSFKSSRSVIFGCAATASAKKEQYRQ